MRHWITTICLTLLLISCSPQERPSDTMDYQETKQMVLDILKTEDGKKAVQDMMKDPEFKKEVAISDTTVTKAVGQAIHDQSDQMQKFFQDPKVAANFAKATQKQHKQLLKQLMKDPEYQRMLAEVMNNPDFEKQMTDLMKTEPYRKQLMVMMTEALDNPIFKEKYMKLMIKANEEALKSKKQGDQQSGGGDQSGGGGQSGDGGGQSGGGGGS